jgi:asparagine synthase (glutamine-hydrolysing)
MQLFGFAGPGSDADALERHVRTQADPGSQAGAPVRGGCAAPSLWGDKELTVALKGDPQWWPGSGDAPPAAATVGAAYRQAGEAFLDRLHGSFALAIVDRRSDTVLLAVDRMGIESLAYATSGGGIVFGSACGGVARFPGRQVTLRNQALLDLFLMHMIPSPNTVFEGVSKLEPGTCVSFRGGRTTVRRYWAPAFQESLSGSVADLEAQLHASLRDAVAACRPDAATGAFLSGGLDSSTVAGVLAAVSDGPGRTFSIGFGVEAYNELEFARAAARRFGFNAVEYHVTSDDIVTAFPVIARAYEEPFGNSSAVPTYFCAKVAADHGVRHLLAGDGGDELFGGNERYGKQGVFEAYLRLPAVLRKQIIEPIADRIRDEHPFMPLRKFRSYVDQARTPLPERFEYWNLMHRADISMMLDPRFQASVDRRAPLRLMAQVFAQTQAQSLLNRMLSYDWHFTLADNDLRKVGTMCSLAGVKVSYPMLDPRVIDLSLRVPSRVKMEGNQLRSFYKRAMRDFLPQEILNKSKHGFGLPFGVWLKTDQRLGDLIFSLLADLKSRHIVRAEFLDQLIREQRAGDASYFGYAIWDLAMLEAWLKTHVPAFSV